MKIKILIVDDHLVVREGLKLIIETNQKYEVIAEASDGVEAVRLVETHKPDIILLDLNMPEMGGLDTMTVLKAKGLEIPVIILTTYNEDEMMIRGLTLGAKGYLLKDTGREMIFRSIDAAIRRETLLLPEITEKVFGNNTPVKSKKSFSGKTSLTGKEMTVLQAIARGSRSKEIGFDMRISERTVKAHLTNIYIKLGVESRAQAVAVAMELGILDL
ncbi:MULTISPECIES: response regulator [Paenibacillus]|uniref:response regulator n=1 Tax=Paenibacillus TaxID=44249 RepID=UPI00040EF401|nr:MULTISPECIES: response regulator transcription factor [Paenibacillus]KGP82692.1 chemotaxis protein CheY [Paenibacillus sp. MAEPY1]KGP83208.1 chemotaxis protein CheY [Paenibacillus sp. MAEPY2]OZQ60384.1 DNA-binding response regulator [Paenibacillus taichungensis]HBU82438.1 DNA-binding response regulator [Paenibacillus sp.]